MKNQNISRAHLPPPSPHLCPFDLRPGQTAAAACWTSSGSFADSSESRMFTLTRGSLDYTTPWLQHGESAFLFWKKIRFRWTKNKSLLYFFLTDCRILDAYWFDSCLFTFWTYFFFFKRQRLQFFFFYSQNNILIRSQKSFKNFLLPYKKEIWHLWKLTLIYLATWIKFS